MEEYKSRDFLRLTELIKSKSRSKASKVGPSQPVSFSYDFRDSISQERAARLRIDHSKHAMWTRAPTYERGSQAIDILTRFDNGTQSDECSKCTCGVIPELEAEVHSLRDEIRLYDERCSALLNILSNAYYTGTISTKDGDTQFLVVTRHEWLVFNSVGDIDPVTCISNKRSSVRIHSKPIQVIVTEDGEEVLRLSFASDQSAFKRLLVTIASLEIPVTLTENEDPVGEVAHRE